MSKTVDQKPKDGLWARLFFSGAEAEIKEAREFEMKLWESIVTNPKPIDEMSHIEQSMIMSFAMTAYDLYGTFRGGVTKTQYQGFQLHFNILTGC